MKTETKVLTPSDAGLTLANSSNSSDLMPVLASQLRLTDDVSTNKDVKITAVATTDDNIVAAKGLFNDLRSNFLDISNVAFKLLICIN